MDLLTLTRPVSDDYPISSPFGVTRTVNGVTRVHRGIDFSVPEGTPVKAFADGEIFITGWEDIDDHKKGLGLRVWQTFKANGRKIYGWYGHLSEILVDPKEEVKAGQIIGKSGNTGGSTGPHLHVQFKDVQTGEWLDADFFGGHPQSSPRNS